ncbi:MAG: hypothetical protein AAF404_05645 [Pseudomonadota bacterium]
MNDTRLNTELNLQRKSAINRGGAVDLAGRVEVVRMQNLQMDKTIFGGLKGLPRMFMAEKLGKEAVWPQSTATEVEHKYSDTLNTVPPIDQRLVDFMQNECDFSMEHADGSFLEHLVFCHDYAARYYPEHSPNVALLHSILGTGTNTFAMQARKLPDLTALLSDFEAEQVSLFPSTLRLFYNGDFLDELENNIHRLDKLAALHVNRVIDNKPLSVSADSLWINLNYHLMHFVDFVPAANWSTHRSDPLLQMFARLSALLDLAGQRRARVDVTFPAAKTPPVGEQRTLFGRVTGLLPSTVTLKLAKKSIREYSKQAGHNLDYRLEWSQ